MKFYFGGAEIPSHRQLLCQEAISHVALSFMGLRRRTRFTKPWLTTENFSPEQHVLVDSGCHTLNREGVEVDPSEIADIAEVYDEFIRQNLNSIAAYTEFDALAMGKEWIEERRSALDPEKAVVVWHEEWGIDELRRMADTYPYIAVGQGTAGDRDIVPLLRSLSRAGRLHGYGFSSPPLMLAANWYSASSTTWLSAAQHGETFVWTGHELKRYPNRYKGQARKRHRTLFESIGLDAELIEQDDPTENLRLSLWSWQQQIAHISQRHGEGVAGSPNGRKTGNRESGTGVVEVTTSEEETEGATPAPIQRAKKTLPGLEMEAFTHRYTDPEDGERKTRTEYRATAVDLNIRVCDGCFLARKCPEYQPGESCAYEIPIKVRTKEQYIALLDSLIAMQAARVFSMRMSEEVEGGYADPNLSQEMDRMARFVKLKADIEEAGFTFSMKVQQKGEAQIGIISRLFGKEAGGAPALSPAGTVSVEEALGQLGVVDAEVVE
ncbi:hypothetical protein [Saccharothrix sp. ST-888]|uniref:hypothetical protein n=1 Tax=Saccharothrix sp. ST-888 TaxID=1427391 RepID=UPI0005ECB2E4|nr:hypothetical protein [Saccharothrix sp. ST-888]KJK56236.1 hypothetical protein UK12_23935 [Saccharothrix sp. ST-888]